MVSAWWRASIKFFLLLCVCVCVRARVQLNCSAGRGKKTPMVNIFLLNDFQGPSVCFFAINNKVSKIRAIESTAAFINHR